MQITSRNVNPYTNELRDMIVETDTKKYWLSIHDEGRVVIVRPQDTALASRVEFDVAPANELRLAHEAIEIATGNGSYV